MVTPATDTSDRVRQALLEDTRTSKETIDVANDRGMITLTGRVASEAARQAAEEIARQQSGVISVINELKIK